VRKKYPLLFLIPSVKLEHIFLFIRRDFMFSFVHAADLHLDTPFTGLCHLPERVLRQIKDSTFLAYDRLIDFCIEHCVDFLLIAGDIYDSSDRSLRAQLHFREGLVRLAEHGIAVFIVHGNHDPLDGYRAALDWPSSVHFFSGKEVESIPFIKEGKEAARIYGMSYPTSKVTDNIAKKYQKMPGTNLNIGLLHANVGGVSTHSNYAPCQLDDLVQSQFDYWALGHIHVRQVLRAAHPAVIYPGNIQGRNRKEAGEKGCYLVSVSDQGEMQYSFHALDVVRWLELELDLTDCLTEEELIGKMDQAVGTGRESAGDRPVIMQLTLTGATPLTPLLMQDAFLEDLAEQFRDIESPFCWVQAIHVQTTRELTGIDPFLQDMWDQVQQLKGDREQFAQVLQDAVSPLLSEHRLGRKWLNSLPLEVGEASFLDEIERLLTRFGGQR
jgi:DNA repair protein SbcD/Mre11